MRSTGENGPRKGSHGRKFNIKTTVSDSKNSEKRSQQRMAEKLRNKGGAKKKIA